MSHPIKLALALLIATLGAPPAFAHEVDCKGRSGIALSRCERHQKMAATCGSISGEAHFVCDRQFLLAHPLDCKALSGEDARRCAAEGAAFKTCEAKAGSEFMRCVRELLKANPEG